MGAGAEVLLHSEGVVVEAGEGAHHLRREAEVEGAAGEVVRPPWMAEVGAGEEAEAVPHSRDLVVEAGVAEHLPKGAEDGLAVAGAEVGSKPVGVPAEAEAQQLVAWAEVLGTERAQALRVQVEVPEAEVVQRQQGEDCAKDAKEEQEGETVACCQTRAEYASREGAPAEVAASSSRQSLLLQPVSPQPSARLSRSP